MKKIEYPTQAPTPQQDKWPSQEAMDAIDIPMAQRALEEIEKDPSQLISGPELEKRLAHIRRE